MKNLLILFLTTIPFIGYTQKVKYKDLFPIISSAPEEEARNQLRSFLLTEPDHPNTNLRLAMIYEKRYRSSDALTDFRKVMAYAERSKLRYLKCRQLINEREVSRNEEYYASFASSFDKKGRPEINYSALQQKIKNGYDSAELMLKHLPEIYRNFTAAVNKYGEAHKLFFDINNRYRSVDDLCMLYNKNVHQELLNLKSAMDSSVIYFAKYRKLINQFPINQYDQQIELVSINYYRLDGLAELSNFLQNKIMIWNYGDWVNEIFDLIETDIKDIRRDLAAFDSKLTDNLSKLETGQSNIIIEPDKELIYQIKKYDYYSLVVDMIKYKLFKQQLIKKEKQKVFYDTARQERMLSKYNFYSELIKQQVLADSLLSLIETNNTPDKRKKHQEYINSFYNGKEGLELFLQNEKEKIRENFSTYMLSIRTDLLNELQKEQDKTYEWVKYKKQDIPLFLNHLDSASISGEKISTTAIDYRADSSRYISGYKPTPEGDRKVAFLAYLNAAKEVLWMKEFDISIDSGATDASSVAEDIEITKDGCAVIINSMHLTSPLNVNTFIYLDDEGNEKINIRLNTNLYSRKILYDQNNSRFILILKGRDPVQQIKEEEKLNIIAYNTLGDKLWERNISYAGSFEAIVSHQKGYLISGNYTSIKDKSGKTYITKREMNETNPFVAKLSSQGDISKIVVYEEPFAYYIKHVFKINDGNINFFGFKDKYQNKGEDLSYNNEKLIHLMIDDNLKQVRLPE